MNSRQLGAALMVGALLMAHTQAAGRDRAVNHTAIVQPLVKFGGELISSLETVALEMLRRGAQDRSLLMGVAAEARGLMMNQYRGGSEFAGAGFLPLETIDQAVSRAFWRLSGPDLIKIRIGPTGEVSLARAPEPLTLGRGQTLRIPLVVKNEMAEQASLIFASWPGLPGMAGERQQIGVPKNCTRGFLLRVVSERPGHWSGPLRLMVGDRPLEVPVSLDTREVGRLRVRLLDEAGRPTAARFYLRGADGLSRAPADSWERITEKPGEYYFYAEGEFEVELAEGETALEAVKGLEYRPLRETVHIEAGATRELELRLTLERDMAAAGWYSGDAHFHANSSGRPTATPEDVLLHIKGENLNVANVLISNSLGSWVLDDHYLEGRLNALSTDRHLMFWGEEIRSRQLYGHMALLNLQQPVEPLYTGWPGTRYPYDYPPHHFHALQAHRQGATVTYVHLGDTDPNSLDGARAHELPVDLALGQVDAADVFSQHPERPALELWYRLLNTGLKCPISAGTDAYLNSKTAPIPGGSRVYVHTGSEFNYASWLENLKRGKTFATNGPLVEFRVEGKSPGEEVRLAREAASVRVEVAARSLLAPMEKVEIVVNGRPVESIPVGADPHRVRIVREVPLERSSWVAARVVGPPHRLVVNDDELLAHTSPVYCYRGGEPIGSPEDARFFVAWIDDLIRKVNHHGVFSGVEQKYEIIQLFRRAQAIYAEKARR